MSLDLEAIRVRAAAATPGPWTADHEWCQINTPDGRRLLEVLLGDNDTRDNARQAIADAEFVAHANQDVSALLAEIGRLQSLNTMLGANVDAMEAEIDPLIAERDRLLRAFGEAAELDTAVAEVKRQLGVEAAEARVIAPRLPQHLRTRFWEECIHQTLGTELAVAEAAERQGWVRPGDADALRSARDAATGEWNRLLDERERMRVSLQQIFEVQGCSLESLLAMVEMAYQHGKQHRDRANHAEAELDAALASLAEERKQTARMQAVVEAWRPVVEATRVYVLDEDPRNDQFQAIVTAIDRMPWEYLNLVDPLRIPPDALDAGAAAGGEGGT